MPNTENSYVILISHNSIFKSEPRVKEFSGETVKNASRWNSIAVVHNGGITFVTVEIVGNSI